MSEARTENLRLKPLDTSAHCLEGGTFVTNINEDDVPFVEFAVVACNDSRIVIHDKPCLSGRGIPTWKSLHWLGPMARGGGWAKEGPGKIWEIVDRLREQHHEWLKLKDFAP